MFKFRHLETAETLFLKVFIDMLNFTHPNSFINTESTGAEWSAISGNMRPVHRGRQDKWEKKKARANAKEQNRFKYVYTHTCIYTYTYVCVCIYMYIMPKECRRRNKELQDYMSGYKCFEKISPKHSSFEKSLYSTG